VGRKTDNIYTTPIVAVIKTERYFIPLPYGEDVDWMQNIKSKGSCKIKIDGEWNEAMEPQVIGADDAINYFPVVTKIFLRIHKVEKYLSMKRHSCLPK